MSSALTLYPNNPLQSSSSAGKLDTTAPTASTSTTGWTVGTTSVSFPYSLLSYNAEKANFSSGALPSGGPVTAAAHFAQDCWRLSSVTSGTFSAGTWYSSLSLLAVTARERGGRDPTDGGHHGGHGGHEPLHDGRPKFLGLDPDWLGHADG